MDPMTISGVSAVTGPGSAWAATLSAQRLTSGTSQSTGAEFGNILSHAIQGVADRQQTAADLSVKAVTGQLDNVHDYTIAATEAAVSLELATTVRNRLVDAFTEIMRLQA